MGENEFIYYLLSGALNAMHEITIINELKVFYTRKHGKEKRKSSAHLTEFSDELLKGNFITFI